VWIDDIITQLELEGVGTFNTNIFATSKGEVPKGDGPFLSIRTTGGTSADRTHNSVIKPAYVRPGAQLVARAKTYRDAEAMAYAAYFALVKVRNQVIGSGNVWYREITALQEPSDLGLDKLERPQVAFNVLGNKRTS
jgi:hypothetical protein